jgi:hypothetical protein
VRPLLILCTALAVATAASPAWSQTFAAMVSPPRFELTAKPGETVRSVFELNNRADGTSEYLLHTADWTLSPEFNVTFSDELAPGSCRPWVALERPSALLPGGGTIRYRFEVAVPADAAPGECRFAIMIEGKESSIAKAGAVSMPMTGRIGLIVYMKVGDASPNLELAGNHIVKVSGRDLPTLRMRNTGNAHGRVSGFLTGTDANGTKYDFNPSDFPILAGTEADVYLTPSTSTDDHPVLVFPVHVQGTLEWEKNKLKIDEHFE